MNADDDGFVNSPKRIMRNIGAAEGDIKTLCDNRFIIPFESGIVVIKHWFIHNYIRGDRYKETVYLNEKNMLEIKENKAYTEVGMTDGTPMVCIDKSRVDKNRVDKINIDKDIVEYLNLIAGTKFRPDIRKTKDLIKARLNEGFSEDDFYRVIDTKTKEWINNKEMKKYIRPETLFGTKFESYLNQNTEKKSEAINLPFGED
jgi:uncharacterized phage protein (TIGR02220 family)